MSEFELVAIAVVTVLSSARLTRLATVDKFPPVKWFRDRYEKATEDSGWDLLTMCGYCFSFWATAVVVAAGYLSEFHEVWWLVNGTLAASYAAAIVMANDGDEETS